MKEINHLAKYLKLKPTEIEFDKNTYHVDGDEYMVLTDEEADKAVREYILESVWAFNSDFLASHMTDISADDLKPIQEKCESANPIILKLIDDLDHFVSDAVLSDGRGHFLSGYDGEEIDLGDGYYAYKV